MLFSHNFLWIVPVDDVKLTIKDLLLTRLVLDKGAKESLKRLVEKVGTRDQTYGIGVVHAYLPLTKEFVR